MRAMGLREGKHYGQYDSYEAWLSIDEYEAAGISGTETAARTLETKASNISSVQIRDFLDGVAE
jgi:hypothetical protein